MKIRISRVIERTNAAGKVSFSQAINVSQFPHRDATVWHRTSDVQYCYTPGIYDAEPYFVESEWTDKTTGKTNRRVDIRFSNLTTVAV